MKMVWLAVAGFALGGSVVVAAGCEPTSKLDVTMEEGPTAVRANLPAVPTLPPPPFPLEYSPGTFSIFGVRHLLAKNINKKITIRAYVTKIYEAVVPGSRPPRHCGERDQCEQDKPYFIIADTAGDTEHDHSMIVTGYASFQTDIDRARNAMGRDHSKRPPNIEGTAFAMPVDLEVGDQVEVTGTLSRSSQNGGHSDSNGLMNFESHVNMTRPLPPPTPPH